MDAELQSRVNLENMGDALHLISHDERLVYLNPAARRLFVKQGLDPQSLDFGKELYASGNMVKKDIKVKQGVDKDTAKKVVKIIKDTGLKVQASIMDEQVRVTGKKIDDLQELISILEKSQVGIPMQYENFRS